MIDEKKLIEYINIMMKSDNVAEYNCEISGEEIIELILDMPKVGEWIPVSERLPKPYDLCTLPILEQPQYLILRTNGLYAVATYKHIYNDCWINEHSYCYDDVVAWQPLSELYKECK